MIEESELRNFANDPSNNIRLGNCESNALKVYKKFGGVVFEGSVTFLDADNIPKHDFHYWNIIESNDTQESDQLVDIANYLTDSRIFYSNHRGKVCSVSYLEGLPKQREIDKQNREALEQRLRLEPCWDEMEAQATAVSTSAKFNNDSLLSKLLIKSSSSLAAIMRNFPFGKR